MMDDLTDNERLQVSVLEPPGCNHARLRRMALLCSIAFTATASLVTEVYTVRRLPLAFNVQATTAIEMNVPRNQSHGALAAPIVAVRGGTRDIQAKARSEPHKRALNDGLVQTIGAKALSDLNTSDVATAPIEPIRNVKSFNGTDANGALPLNSSALDDTNLTVTEAVPLVPLARDVTTAAAAAAPWAALCAVMKDEDLYINEWTDYHLALGFEHVYIYDSHPNFTLASWFAARQENEARDEGTIFGQTNTTTNRVHLIHRVLPDDGPVQELVYGECLAQLRALPVPPKWVMVLDGDEYLVFRDMDRYPNVTTFLTEHLRSGSLQINWVVMGSANETDYRNEPVTKRFQLAVSGSHHPQTKAVAILDHVDGWKVHYAHHKAGYKAIGMAGRKASLNGALCCIKDGDVSVAAVFHYKYKSYGEFNHRRCGRGDIYKSVNHTCPPSVEVGDVWDDSAWRALTRLLPQYSSWDKSNGDGSSKSIV